MAYKWFRKNGYRLPEDISIIGVGDSEKAYYAYPELSTIRQPRISSGTEAVRMLEKLLERPNSQSENITLQSEWVCRDSVTACTTQPKAENRT
ncbi:substrate-binding domain-containing protein [Puniceicoccus vermicola]|uniref:Substrate-binding domain-containing protein n=1 Tax=Puniceicoccus vermicola TaxID=388746 RepID=A0A7X1E552_9BACT|nr:substrate-binding domain-containing protein [Puniceicoccus vermicola]MBC2602673.1 substrate-binding domain-containing protein [Puniceicoccus vermicola]